LRSFASTPVAMIAVYPTVPKWKSLFEMVMK